MNSTTTLSLILKNDDKNSFIRVIIALVHVMGYEQLQAEQIATLVHHKGQMTLRTGGYAELEELKYKLEEMDLNVEIE
jgi:ATP-dependent Clp protease adapter protein ClpS